MGAMPVPDVYGNDHFFEEKAPVVSAEDFSHKVDCPVEGSIESMVIRKNENMLTIDVGYLGRADESGNSIFDIFEEQVIVVGN